MRYKELTLTKLEQLENLLRNLDQSYRRAEFPYEKDQVYDKVKEKVEEIRTLINVEFE